MGIESFWYSWGIHCKNIFIVCHTFSTQLYIFHFLWKCSNKWKTSCVPLYIPCIKPFLLHIVHLVAIIQKIHRSFLVCLLLLIRLSINTCKKCNKIYASTKIKKIWFKKYLVEYYFSLHRLLVNDKQLCSNIINYFEPQLCSILISS